MKDERITRLDRIERKLRACAAAARKIGDVLREKRFVARADKIYAATNAAMFGTVRTYRD